jgi:transcriptional regulator with XRE-family HTH domain
VSEFRAVFCARIKALRLSQSMSQVEMAAALGIGAEAYRAYESRSLLPHHLVERFAILTGVEIQDLFTSSKLSETAAHV